MTREYARAPRGERAHGTVPRNAGTVTTMIGALDVKGVRAMMTIEGATDAEVFETFLERFLLRKLKPGDIVVLDNVGAHKTAEVRRLIRSAGARVLYLPPYSPDLNPIELAWSKLKGLLRDFGARTRDALDDASVERWTSSTVAMPPPGSLTAATPVSSSDRRCEGVSLRVSERERAVSPPNWLRRRACACGYSRAGRVWLLSGGARDATSGFRG